LAEDQRAEELYLEALTDSVGLGLPSISASALHLLYGDGCDGQRRRLDGTPVIADGA